MKIEFDELNIYEIEKFHKYLEENYKNSQNEFELDFENVEKIDFTAIQLLISLTKTAKKDNKQLKLININDSILEKLKECKIDSILGINND